MGGSNRRDDDLFLQTNPNWTGMSDRMVNENGEIEMKRTSLAGYVAWMLVAVVGVAVAAWGAVGPWWALLLGAVIALVGLVGAVNYKYASHWFDIVVILLIVGMALNRIFG